MLILSEIPGLYGTFKMEEVILCGFGQNALAGKPTSVQKKRNVDNGISLEKVQILECSDSFDSMIVGGDIEVLFRKDWLSWTPPTGTSTGLFCMLPCS